MKFSQLIAFGWVVIQALGSGCQSVDREDANLFFLKGNVQLTQKNYQEAIRFYREAIDKNPEFADAFLNLGLAYLQLGKLEEAQVAFSAAIEQDDSLLPAYLARAETATRLSQWDEAERDLNALNNAYADSSQYFLIKGNMLMGKNNPAAALAEYDKSVALNPKNAEAHVNRGAIYFSQKAYPLAAKDFEQALQINPNQLEALNNLGLLASRERNWDKALMYLDRALRMNSADPLSLNNKGYVLLRIGKREEAFKLISRSLDTMPENGYALRNLGLYYLEKQDLKESIASFEKALALAQLVESLHGYAGEAYRQNGNKAKACTLWNQGIILQDSMATAKYAEYCP
jgi:tetratricopeptide (TPR) repeat protein